MTHALIVIGKFLLAGHLTLAATSIATISASTECIRLGCTEVGIASPALRSQIGVHAAIYAGTEALGILARKKVGLWFQAVIVNGVAAGGANDMIHDFHQVHYQKQNDRAKP